MSEINNLDFINISNIVTLVFSVDFVHVDL
jgi:hypothetical protein